jgi:hypothetical protein
VSGILPDVEGGILPPGICAYSSGNDEFKPSCVVTGFSAGLEARLYGRQDARHYIRVLRAFYLTNWNAAGSPDAESLVIHN